MPNFATPRILTLDEAFEYLDEVYKEAILEDNIASYIMEVTRFIDPDYNSDKIKNLKSNQYTVEVRKSPNIFRLDLYKKDKIPTTTLTDEQIKKIQELNDYLNTPEVLKIRNHYKRIAKIAGTFFISLAIVFLYFFIKV